MFDSSIILRSTIISLTAFTFTVMVMSDQFVKRELEYFSRITTAIDQHKMNVVLFSKYLSERIENSASNEADMSSILSYTKQQYGEKFARVYSMDDSKICAHSAVVLLEFNRLLESFDDIYQRAFVPIKYRSFICNKLFTNIKNDDFVVNEAYFGREKCQSNNSCAKYASQRQLSDNVVISSLYANQLVDGQLVISISSPVRYQGEIIGDFSIDLPVDEAALLENGKRIVQKSYGTYKQHIIQYADYPFERFSHTEEHVADNQTIFVYRVPIFKVLTDYFWLLFVYFLMSYLLFRKFAELKFSRAALKEVRIQAQRDELTGLYNRSILNDDYFVARVESKPTSIIAIDGDSLKRINDKFGHAFGDQSIKYIADKLVDGVRDNDYVLRLGGDEFLVVLVGCEVDFAHDVARKIQHAIGSDVVNHHGLTVSVSYGVTALKKGESFQRAIERADKELYKAKRS